MTADAIACPVLLLIYFLCGGSLALLSPSQLLTVFGIDGRIEEDRERSIAEGGTCPREFLFLSPGKLSPSIVLTR